MTVLEVGCWTGMTSVLLGKLTKKVKGTLRCVDAFKGSEDSNLTCADYVNIQRIHKDNIERNDVADVITVNNVNSHNFNFNPEVVGLYDFIFIDADHRYECAKFDMENCYKILKPGGIICGHDCEYLISSYYDLFIQTEKVDYTQCHTGVIRAVYEVFGYKAKVTPKGYIWWVQKGK